MRSISSLDLLGIRSLADYGAMPGQDIYRALTIANAYCAGSGVMWLPPGAYTLSADFSPSAGVTLEIGGGVTITGAGTLTPGLGQIVDMRDGLAVNGVQVGALSLTAGAALTAKRFVAANLQTAAVDSLTVIGVATAAAAAIGADACVAAFGLQLVTADAPLAVGDPVKVGVGGRATKHTTSQTTLQTTITGEATAFTQPVGATALEVLQAADVAADRGRGIVIEGSDGTGAAITETISLHGTNTTTPVAGTTSFTKIAAVYTADGAVLGAQNVTVRAAAAGATVCTLAGATSELGADIPAETQQAYCNEITVTGPNADATFVTIIGIDSADAEARERVQLNGASPSVVTTTTVFRLVSRICLGEFTNAAAGNVKTNATVDTAAMKCGLVLTAAAARGDNAIVLIKPNA